MTQNLCAAKFDFSVCWTANGHSHKLGDSNKRALTNEESLVMTR